MRIAYLIFAALAFSDQALPADLEIKGVRVGMTKAELQAAHPGLNCDALCYHSARSPRNHVKSLETVAGVSVSSWWFNFTGDKLTRSYATFAASAGAVVTLAFTEKFGKPTNVENGEFRTAGGLTGAKVTTTWAEGDSVVVITYPSGKISEAKIEIFSKAARDAEVEAFKSKAKKDL